MIVIFNTVLIIINLLSMFSLTPRSIISNNTIDCNSSVLPTLNATFNRYRDSLTNLNESKNREKVLKWHLQKRRLSLKNGKKLIQDINHAKEMADLDRYILYLKSIEQETSIEKQMRNNIKRRKKGRKHHQAALQHMSVHNSTIYQFTQRQKAQNERNLSLERQKIQKIKEIGVMQQRIQQKQRVYKKIQFYQSRMHQLKHEKSLQAKQLNIEMRKNAKDIDKRINRNVRLRLKNQKSLQKLNQLRGWSKLHLIKAKNNPEDYE